MPSPSTGCQTCKTRRIKCDEKKPICQRCVKSRRICVETSAAKQASFTIHIENGYVNGKRKRPRGPRSSLTLLCPNIDMQTHAISYYLQYHMQTFTDVSSVSGCLPESVSAWTISQKQCSLVDLAVSSMALAVFSRLHYPPAAAEALSKYQRLLGAAQDYIVQVRSSALDALRIDACLLAICLMGRYETVMHTPSDQTKENLVPSQHWSHHDGAMAVLKVWHDSWSQNGASGIVKQTRRGLIKSSLLRTLRLPKWIEKGDQFGEYGFELDYDRIVVTVVNLHYVSTKIKQNCHLPTKREFEELNNEAKKLDTTLQNWATQFPKTYSYQMHDLDEAGPWPKNHFYSSTVYSYSRPEYSTIWSEYFATRMLINSTRLKILDNGRSIQLADFDFEEQRLECNTLIEVMANSLASTVPFCLERFKVTNLPSSNHQTSISLTNKGDIKPYLASLVVWPLSIASSLEGVGVGQQTWFRAELARLGKIQGDGVLARADADAWPIKL